ncbi:hypothetical protein PHET_07062 [Paragonimus heterotremus]|uniref:Uncharacterized protein n=1 Tax=Paragonimus heterotremus TaxID=100268 RepID=A0A8J4TDK3_9TREM|nr:hypothetical protein PHET_07062 [Paragonimus heterotremus]
MITHTGASTLLFQPTTVRTSRQNPTLPGRNPSAIESTSGIIGDVARVLARWCPVASIFVIDVRGACFPNCDYANFIPHVTFGAVILTECVHGLVCNLSVHDL